MKTERDNYITKILRVVSDDWDEAQLRKFAIEMIALDSKRWDDDRAREAYLQVITGEQSKIV